MAGETGSNTSGCKDIRGTSLRCRVGVAAILALAACGAPGAQLPRTDAMSPPEALFNGYTKPAVNCFHCHGGDARGSGKGPDLRPRVKGMTEAQITHVILHGHDDMPAFRGKLTDDEAAQLATWLRGKFNG